MLISRQIKIAEGYLLYSISFGLGSSKTSTSDHLGYCLNIEMIYEQLTQKDIFLSQLVATKLFFFFERE